MKKIKIFFIIIFCIIFFNKTCIYASFADFTDEEAEKQTQNMIQEHEKEFDSTKSDNNYLKDLKITGGELSPNFERQTLEYTLKLENKTNQIEITATPEDEHAKINGTGKIDILKISECKVEVVAESGTTRTYFIKLIKQNEESKEEIDSDQNHENEQENNNNTIIENEIKNTSSDVIETTEQNSNTKNNSNKKYFIYAGGAIILVCILFIIIKNINKKSRH